MRKVRTRTFHGCLTCRSRKVKCDQTRPLCNNCQRLNLECQGYGLQLHWQQPWNPSIEKDLSPLGDTSGVRNKRSRTEFFSGMSVEGLRTSFVATMLMLSRRKRQAMVRVACAAGRGRHFGLLCRPCSCPS
jgi:hypothetical protein